MQTAFDEKKYHCMAEKERIGKAAALLIESDQRYDWGRKDCAEIARHIIKGLRLTVATQSTAIADELGPAKR